ncbi:diacylglycerol kinase family protein [Sporosarcina sp. Marseille-Q4063]|uniref:diacylglycerol kinase family protein n=1 Tax=Sporosarcina sp. Marseille-Q4063 TaxID=2810514 RepID=UPI00201600E1|nr:diacylglycerol kinase family protein [Sporosarcina sp. Marseille-Q4063]
MQNFIKAFRYAFEGILHAVKTERNFKFHLIAAGIVILSGLLTGLADFEWYIILVLIGGVLSLELLNSAIERVVNLVTMERLPLAKQAKDLAAGAVLIFAIFSAVIGLLIFIPKWIP